MCPQIFGFKIILCLNNSLPKKCWSKNNFRSKKFWGLKLFGLNKFQVKKSFGSCPKKICVYKYFGSRNVRVKKNFGSKKFTLPILTWPVLTCPWDTPQKQFGYHIVTLKIPSRQPPDTLQTISKHVPDTHKTVTKFQTCRVIPSARS